MATAPPDTMQMPQQGANPFADPNTMAVYDQMRQTTSPKAFGDEMLAGAAQADPQAVAKFLQKLQSLNVPPEVLDALNNVVDEILANPERYDELRAKYIAQGLPEKILPAQFDPQFFVALNMAIDQMIAEPAGVQSFAQGGIAELKPIAQAIASYGRNGDTMLAHITPAEARMLRRRGGSGTTNPDTGLPEFFLDEIGDALGGIGDAIGDAIGGIGDAVQDFVESDVGQMITTVAIGYFLGPAVAAQFGVTSAVGVAAISGFVGGAGGTLLGGGSFEDALKAGAIGGLTAGAGAGVFGGSEAFAARPSITPGQAFQGQVDKFTGMISPTPGPSGAAPAPVGIDTGAPVPTPSDVTQPANPYIQKSTVGPLSVQPADVTQPANPYIQKSTVGPAPVQQAVKMPEIDLPGTTPPPKPPSTMFDQAKDFINKNISPSGIQEQAIPGAQKAAADAVAAAEKTIPANITGDARSAMLKTAYENALKAATPGMFATYAPITGIGLGALGAFGGFEAKPVQSGPITKSLMTPVTQRIAEEGTQRQMYSQGLPGVVYDQYGAPVYGQSVRLPTYDVPDYNSGGYGMPQGGMNMPTAYISPPGTIGSRRVEQPYNNSDMYPNLVPRQYAADGGLIQNFSMGGIAKAITDALEADKVAKEAEQKAARDAVAQQKALRKSQGSGQMYSNLNAGLAALAPERNPMDPTDTKFGERNRLAGLAGLGTTYGPMLQAQRDAMSQQRSNLGSDEIVMMQPNQPGTSAVATGQPSSGNVLTPEIARTLMQKAETIGLPYSESDMYGGYAAVKAMRDAGGGNSGSPQPATQPFPIPRYTNAGKQPTTPLPLTPKPVVAPPVDPYSNITGPQAAQTGYTGPNLYGQALAIGMPARDAMLPAYNYSPLATGATTRLPSTYSTGNTPVSEATRKETQYQGLLDQGATPAQIRYARETMFGPQTSTGKSTFMNMGGIATLGAGGYPRRTGQISGPGTEKSDSIPAMLSDGEFVMTAKAVRNAGKGSRRAGAKKMYALMHRLEKNSERG